MPPAAPSSRTGSTIPRHIAWKLDADPVLNNPYARTINRDLVANEPNQRIPRLVAEHP